MKREAKQRKKLKFWIALQTVLLRSHTQHTIKTKAKKRNKKRKVTKHCVYYYVHTLNFKKEGLILLCIAQKHESWKYITGMDMNVLFFVFRRVSELNSRPIMIENKLEFCFEETFNQSSELLKLAAF